jgi:hypothetical protein
MGDRCHFCGSERPDLAWMVTLGDTVVLICPDECDDPDYYFLRALSRMPICERPRYKAE